MASAKMATASGVRIDNVECGGWYWNSASASLLREFCLFLPVRVAPGVDTEFPYRVRIVDRGVDCRDPVCRHRFRFLEIRLPARPRGETRFRGSPRQTKPKKDQFMNFSRGQSGTKVRCESRMFSPRKNTRIHKNGRYSWTLRFGPCFGLVCRGDSWKVLASKCEYPPFLPPFKCALSSTMVLLRNFDRGPASSSKKRGRFTSPLRTSL